MSVRFPAILGVSLRLQELWLIAYALLAIGIFAIGVPGGPSLSIVPAAALALVAAIVLVVDYAIHELTHSIVARRLGLPISEVTLFGLPDRNAPLVEPANGRAEAVIAISGVVVSYVLAGLLWLTYTSIQRVGDEWVQVGTGIVWWAAIGNLALGIINSALAYPYDGGRVVRGICWSVMGDKLRATRLASRIGRLFAIGLMFGGAIWAFLTGDFLDPLWLFVAGLFLLQSARRQVSRLEIRQAVEGLTVGDVMDENFSIVGPNLTLDTLFDQHERAGEVDTYPVMADGELLGSIDVGQIERVPRPQWGRTRVTDVMTTLERLQTMTRKQSVMDALTRFDGTTVDAIPVVDDEGKKIVGLVTRDGLIDKLRPRVRRIAEEDGAVGAGS